MENQENLLLAYLASLEQENEAAYECLMDDLIGEDDLLSPEIQKLNEEFWNNVKDL